MIFSIFTVSNCIYINYYYNGNFLIKSFYTYRKICLINYIFMFLINKTLINESMINIKKRLLPSNSLL